MEKLKNLHKHSQSGFTIVEFLIATAVFAMVILICSFAIIHVGRMYYKGVLMNRTQDTSREVMDDIVAAIQFGEQSNNPDLFARLSDPVTYNDVQVRAWCLGNVRYSFAPGAVLSDSSGVDGDITRSRHVLWRDSLVGNCVPLDITQADPGGVDARELLGSNMRLPQFDIARPATGEAWGVSIRVVYGDSPDLFFDDAPFAVCRGAAAGGQFCAVSSLQTSVTKRL